MWRVLFVSIVTAATVCAAEGQDQRISGNDLLDACRAAANGATPSDSSLKVGMCLGELDALNWIMPGIYHEDVRSWHSRAGHKTPDGKGRCGLHGQKSPETR